MPRGALGRTVQVRCITLSDKPHKVPFKGRAAPAAAAPKFADVSQTEDRGWLDVVAPEEAQAVKADDRP